MLVIGFLFQRQKVYLPTDQNIYSQYGCILQYKTLYYNITVEPRLSKPQYVSGNGKSVQISE